MTRKLESGRSEFARSFAREAALVIMSCATGLVSGVLLSRSSTPPTPATTAPMLATTPTPNAPQRRVIQGECFPRALNLYAWGECATGPGGDWRELGPDYCWCACYDMDWDRDVDLEDFARTDGGLPGA